MFELLGTTPIGRRGRLTTAHGRIETPFFMPVGTAGAMKGLTHEDLLSLGAQILLCNTYHLHLQPGEDIVAEAGGLHEFIGWKKPILTDSGGFQVFSLRGISDITEDGVHFQSHLDGKALFLGPRESMRIQHTLGADIIMCFDQCPPSTAPRADQEDAVRRTLAWAAICKEEHMQLCEKTGERPMLFGIVQGGLEPDLRKRCAAGLVAIGFDGYAAGGLAVGETEEQMLEMLSVICPELPADQPRYLMGVGRLNQIRDAVALGIDMFDCVLPMREARHGNIYLQNGTKIRIPGASFAHDHSPIDPDSPSVLSRTHHKSYLRHLIHSGERLGETIACLQNLGVTLDLTRRLRADIDKKLDR